MRLRLRWARVLEIVLCLLVLGACGRRASTGSSKLWVIDESTGFYRGPDNSSLWINGAADGGSCVQFPTGLFKDVGSGPRRVQGPQCGTYRVESDGAGRFSYRVDLYAGFEVRGLTLAFDLPRSWSGYCTDGTLSPINTHQPGPWGACGTLPSDAVAGDGEVLVGLNVCGASYLEHVSGSRRLRRTLLGGWGNCHVYLFNGLSYTSEVGWFQALGNAPLVPAGRYAGSERIE